jgi:hypothetical protein
MNARNVKRVAYAAQRGGIVVRKVLAIVFRVTVAVIFLPVAFACFAKSDSFGGWIAIACAFGIGALLAPMPDD